MPVDPSAYVAPTARVHPDATIGPRTKIGEFVCIDHSVTIGADCLFEPYCYVKPWTTIGDRNEFSAGVALGTDPLDKAFNGERSYLTIGSGNKIREHWTISRGTAPESITIIGDENFFMTSGHVAHNCIVGSYTVIASNTLVAGYAEVEDRAFLSGGVVVHQFSKIGAHVMVAGNVRVNSDLPPYFLYSDFNVSAKGLNLVGLKRCGFKLADINPLKTAYKLLYRSNLKLEDALQRIETEIPTSHTLHLVEFIRASKRGICRE
jgi:UDP-N-acetylglucosamine acyltransferase